MTDSSIWEIAGAVVLSLGGGGAVVALLSSWLGKLWAERLMARETAAHARDLEELRSTLSATQDAASHLFRQKIELYKEVSAPLILLVTSAQIQGGAPSQETYIQFEKQRLQSTALLAMFAPSEVFDSHNTLLDYVLDTMDGSEQWSFDRFRKMALEMLSLIRKDVGMYTDAVTYRGHR